jgi:hypothetical protein
MKHNMPDLVLAAFTERDSWYYLPFCCNPQLLVNNRSKKTDPPENANIPSRSHCSNKYVNAPRKQRQPKTRPAEASVRGGNHLIISSLETNRSFELQILSFSSESLMGLNRVILLALAAHELMITCPLEHLVTKIGRLSNDTNKQGIKRGNEKSPRNWGTTVGARRQVPKPLQTFQPRWQRNCYTGTMLQTQRPYLTEIC